MASTRLEKTFTASNRKTFTISTWIKRSGLTANNHSIYGAGTNSSTDRDYLAFLADSGAEDKLYFNAKVSSSVVAEFYTNRRFRDTSAWMHIVLAFDTTQATDTNRMKLYVNGELQTFSSVTYPNQNRDMNTNNTVHKIGSTVGNSYYFDGSMTHFNFIDGTAYTPTSFGEVDATSGIWKAKSSASVTYGNNGFFLKFENSGAMGTDSSGNSNNFTVSGTLTQNVDTPDNNFATINPLYYSSTGLLNGNITATSTGNSHKNYHSTIAVDSGKWYAEMKVNSWNGSNNIMFGIVADSWNNINSTSPGDNFAGNASTGIGYGSNGQKIIANSASSYGNSFTTGDILGIALDLTNNKLYFSKNGTYQNSGVPTSGSTGTGAIDVPSGFTRLITFSHYGSQSCSMNFGNGYFGTTAVASANADGNGVGKMEYAVPTGYYTLNTKNIKEFG